MAKHTKKSEVQTTEFSREDYSIAINALADKDFSNEQISQLLHVSRNKVGAVMAWRNNRKSWMK